MKQVTIDNVKVRIAQLETSEHIGGRLPIRHEFEMACLRQLMASLETKPVAYSLIFRNTEGKLNDYVNVNTTFATMEESQAYGKGGRYVTQGDGSIEWVADPSLDPVVVPLYTTPPVKVISVDDDVRSVVSLLESNEWAENCTKTELGQRLESEITRLVGNMGPVPVASDADPSFDAMMRALDAFYADDNVPERAMLAAFRILQADLRNQVHQGLATDNTAQQFEALATSGKSEHLLNAERIAREAQALSNSLNATSEVNHRVSGWSERQQKVIAYSLWRFSCTAYQKANQAAQTNNKNMFDRFIRDARCAEEIREEFTSAWSGKP